MDEASLSAFFCACCGEINEIWVDPSGGNQQSYVEDCRICCRPNVLKIKIDEDTGAINIEAEFEG